MHIDRGGLSLAKPFDDTETKCEGTSLPPRAKPHKGQSPSPRGRSASAANGCVPGSTHGADGDAAAQAAGACDDETQECIEALRALVQEEQAMQARLVRLQGLYRRVYAIGFRLDPALTEALAVPAELAAPACPPLSGALR